MDVPPRTSLAWIALMASALSRRDFFSVAGSAAVVSMRGHAASVSDAGSTVDSTAANPLEAGPPLNVGSIPTRLLGKTGARVSILGLGGFHLGRAQTRNEATRIAHEAIDAGVNFFDNAWEYNDGRSEEWMGAALEGKRDGIFLMTKCCAHGRAKDVALQQLDESLRRLKTDHVDLWQVHECVYENDPQNHFSAGGMIEALDEAKRRGKVRFVGFTGHKDPRIHLAMLSHGYPFDTCQMPLNCFDGSFRSFEQRVLPELAKQNIAAIGMKSLCGLGEPIVRGIVTIEEALGYAMSIPGVATTVCGMDTIDILRQNISFAKTFAALDPAAMKTIRDRVADVAGDGHFELYKTTTRFDAKIGREQHGYPTEEELPL